MTVLLYCFSHKAVVNALIPENPGWGVINNTSNIPYEIWETFEMKITVALMQSNWRLMAFLCKRSKTSPNWATTTGFRCHSTSLIKAVDQVLFAKTHICHSGSKLSVFDCHLQASCYWCVLNSSEYLQYVGKHQHSTDYFKDVLSY